MTPAERHADFRDRIHNLATAPRGATTTSHAHLAALQQGLLDALELDELRAAKDEQEAIPARRYHGWHWWLGIANELDCNGQPLVVDRWYAVHCWTANGVLMAMSAHWQAPMRQDDMRGKWGPEIVPPKDEPEPRRLKPIPA